MLPPPVLVVLPPPEFPEVELPPPADALPPLELVPPLELDPLEELELPPAELLLELPELEVEPLAPLAPACPVLPATLVEVFTWVLETLKLASAAVLTFTLGAVVLTTVELLRPLESVFA